MLVCLEHQRQTLIWIFIIVGDGVFIFIRGGGGGGHLKYLLKMGLSYSIQGDLLINLCKICNLHVDFLEINE